MTGPDLTPAEPEDLAETIAYALRFNERGKPLAVETRKDSAVLARWVVRHLARCGFVVMKKPPMPPHSTR
jgi:hypothetical protein